VEKRFELLAHTADIGIIARGKDMKEAFINAARGLFSLMLESGEVEAKEYFHIEVNAPDREALLVNWLSELIYLADAKGMLFSQFNISRLSDIQLSADAGGEKVDGTKHHLKREVKAATYHKLKVEQVQDGWRAQVIFDI